MAVAVVQSDHVYKGGEGSDWSPSLTGVAAGSVMVLALYNNDAATTETYSVDDMDFDEIAALNITSDRGNYRVWVATGKSGTVNPNVTCDGSDWVNGSCLLIELSGADTTTSSDVTPTTDQQFTSTIVIPSIDPVTDDCLHIIFQGQYDDDPSTHTGPSGYTQFEACPGDRGLSGWHKLLSGGAATGTINSDTSAGGMWGAISVAIRPAAGGGLSIPVAMAQYRQRWR